MSSLANQRINLSAYVKDGFENAEESTLGSTLPVSVQPVKRVNKPPSSGEEYLRMVRLEATQIPDVFLAVKPPIHTTGQKKAANWVKRGWEAALAVTETNSVINQEFLPRLDWELVFMDRFERLRKAFQSFLSKNPNSLPLPPDVSIPKSRAEADWYKFCYGSKLSDKGSEESETKEKPCSLLEDFALEDNKISGNPPFLSIISRLNQQTTLALLSFHINWISFPGIKHSQYQWIFALLIRIDKLLMSEQLSILRELCRKCIEIRNLMVIDPKFSINLTNKTKFSISLLKNDFNTQENSHDQRLSFVNVIITIVRRYFGQKDLG
ncbi:hypothetical protein G9A89_007049 [Geosiphon pyriformis]|nr:hypothetical protein G9A89_007049 [Geosiphon pyriformis]